MPRAVIVLGLLAALSAVPAQAQAERLIGRSIGEHMDWNPATRITRDTSTLTFAGDTDGATATVDFVVQYAGERAFQATRPAVVDVIVTEHPAEKTRRS